jgi:glycine/D-amino acid oxidase-like deaminating enzyme
VDPSLAAVYWLSGTGEVVDAEGRAASAGPPDGALEGEARADVAIIGAGFTGLWTAIRLLETEPALRVVVLEQGVVGYGASGRNGGFCAASLTHGLANGLAHFPDEVDRLEAEGRRNLAELVEFTRRHGLDCDLEETGSLTVADQPHQVEAFRAWVETAAEHGERLRFLDRDEVRAELHSPRWQAGLLAGPESNVMLDPAKLVRGLARVARSMGARVHEATRVDALERRAGNVRVRTAAGGSLRADRVVVATSAYSGWLGWRVRRLFAPVYDYALVSEPLSPDQRAAIGWRGRQGVSDANNHFHYFRLTADERILWGGYDAVYHPGGDVGPHLDQRPATFARLASDFRADFPQLAGLRFPWRWGGAIDTTSRFTVTFGRTLGERVVYALGYTGLGVGASRWAAGVVRDMLLRPDSELLRLRFVRSAPFPFPPEPLRSMAIGLVQREMARADADEGRRGLILRTLDSLGIGFDS